MIKQLLIVLASCICLTMSAAKSSSTGHQLASPDGQYRIEMLHSALPGSDPVSGFYTIVVVRRDEVLSRFPTQGYLISAFWSRDGKYVAVNNRRANSGDYVWVFSLIDGKAIKSPDEIPGEVYADRATREISNISLKTFKKHLTMAKGWTPNGELEVQSDLIFQNLKDEVVLREALYRVQNGELVLAREGFSTRPVAQK